MPVAYTVLLCFLFSLCVNGWWEPTKDDYELKDVLSKRDSTSIPRGIMFFPGFSYSTLEADLNEDFGEAATDCSEQEISLLWNQTAVEVWPKPAWLSFECFVELIEQPSLGTPWNTGVTRVYAPLPEQLLLRQHGPLGAMLSFYGWSPGLTYFSMNWNWLLSPWDLLVNPNLTSYADLPSNYSEVWMAQMLNIGGNLNRRTNSKVVLLAHSEGAVLIYAVSAAVERVSPGTIVEYVELILFFGAPFGGVPTLPFAYWWGSGGSLGEDNWPVLPNTELVGKWQRESIAVFWPDPSVYGDIITIAGTEYEASQIDEISAALGVPYFAYLNSNDTFLPPGWWEMPPPVPTFSFCGTGLKTLSYGSVEDNTTWRGTEQSFSLRADGAVEVESCTVGPRLWQRSNSSAHQYREVVGVYHNNLPFATTLAWLPACFNHAPPGVSGVMGNVAFSPGNYFSQQYAWTAS